MSARGSASMARSRHPSASSAEPTSSSADAKKVSAREALRDIYLRAFEPAQMDSDVKWFFAYCEANVRWIRFINFDFAQWYEHTGQSAVLPFRLMEADGPRSAKGETSRGQAQRDLTPSVMRLRPLPLDASRARPWRRGRPPPDPAVPGTGSSA